MLFCTAREQINDIVCEEEERPHKICISGVGGGIGDSRELFVWALASESSPILGLHHQSSQQPWRVKIPMQGVSALPGQVERIEGSPE